MRQRLLCVLLALFPSALFADGGSIVSYTTSGGSFTGGSVASPVTFPDGTAGAPAIAWTSDADGTGTGFYRRAANEITASLGGTAAYAFDDNSGLVAASGGGFHYCLGTDVTGHDVCIARQAAGIARVQNGGLILHLMGGGAAVASATAMPVPTGNVFHVTGTTAITSITSTGFGTGTCATLIFDGVLNFTDGNNIKIAATMATTADDTITICYDGTNWFEIGRSVN